MKTYIKLRKSRAKHQHFIETSLVVSEFVEDKQNKYCLYTLVRLYIYIYIRIYSVLRIRPLTYRFDAFRDGIKYSHDIIRSVF